MAPTKTVHRKSRRSSATATAAQLVRGIELSLAARDVDARAVLQQRGQLAAQQRRARGDSFELRDYVRALVLAWLTGRRPWSRIAEHLDELALVFKDYDARALRRAKPERLVERVCALHCGNRSIHLQMDSLRANLTTFARIEREFGTLDDFATSEDPKLIARAFSATNGPYKLEQVGTSIAREMLRSVGFELAKPTGPVIRMLGAERLGLCALGAGAEGTALVMHDLAADSGRSLTELDGLLWLFCAPDQGDVCGTDPDCGNCRLARHCAEGARRAKRRR